MIMSNSTKYATMDDVARLSGVSKGTVDRVVHKRGDVSEKTRENVLRIIKEVGYEPNIHASMLSHRKAHTIIAVIPYFQTGDYWELIYKGIMMANNDGKSLNITIDVIYYNQFDINSFRKACSHTLALDPHGVLMAPIYKEDATDFANQLDELNIPLVYIDSKLENTNYLAYFGIPQFESGYLAAYLLIGDEKSSEVVNFNIDRGGDAPANDSMQNRHSGITAYAKDHDLECTIHDCAMLPNDFMNNMRIFDNFFEQHPHINKIIALNSRAYMISEWMEMRNIRDKTIVGFDMLEKNLDGLKKGYITSIITDRTPEQVHQAMSAIIDYLVFKKSPAKKDNYTSMDILNRYNVDFYI